MVLSKMNHDDAVLGSDPDELIIRGRPFDRVQDRSVGRYLLEKIASHGDAVSQIFPPTGQIDTFAAMRTKSVTVAVEMRARGLGLGDVVSICSHNHPDIYYTCLATLYLGAAIAPLDPSLTIDDLVHLMSITRPKTIFVEPKSVEKIARALEKLDHVATIVVYGDVDDGRDDVVPFDPFLNPTRAVDVAGFEPIDFTNPHDHLALIMPSSGSTGLPKGVALSHGNILMCLQLLSDTPMKGIKLLNMSSLFWMTGLLVLFASIDVGVTRVILPGFDPKLTLETIENEKIFWVVLGVTYFARIVGYPNACDSDLSSTKLVSIIGAKASETQLELGQKLFGAAKFLAGYGLTETTGTVFDMLDDPKPGSIGYVCRGIEVKIVDTESGRSVGANKKGELCIRGGIVFKGYHGNRKETDETLDGQGWLHTGDMCWYDEDKCFYIEGRIKELFKCRGWQISPLEMENVLSKHPDVKEVAVIGIAHDVDVARARAYIVLKDGSRTTADDIQTYMRETMNPNKQLYGGVSFVDELPLTPSGKIRKYQLRQWAEQELGS